MTMNRFAKVALTNRLATDPIIQKTQDGLLMSSFPIAVDQHTEPKGDDACSDVYVCIGYGRLAEETRKLLRKGTVVWLEGTLSGPSSDRTHGFRRCVSEILLDNISVIDECAASDGESSDPAVAP